MCVWTNVVVVPSKVITFKRGKPFVATIAEGKVRITPFEIGAADLKHTELKSGLKIGQQIILPEEKALNEGDFVRVISKLAAK